MTAEVAHKSILDNGVRVLTHHIPNSQGTSVGVLVECGTRDEYPGEYGLAHLTEHILFQGTERRSGLDIAREVDSLGGHVSALTSRDYTCFSATVASDYTFQALDLLADIVQNPTCPVEDIEIEKRVVLREMEMIEDMPSRRAQERLQAVAWGDHNLGRPIIGHGDSIRSLDRNHVAHFLAREYTPNRVVIAAAGDLRHDDFVSQVNDCFWRMAGTSVRQSQSPALWREVTSRDTAPTKQSYFCVGFPAIEYEHPSRYAFHLLDRVAGGGMSSRLYRRLRDELGLVYDIRSEYLAWRDGGLWMVEGTTTPEFESQAVMAVLEELENLGGSRPVEDEELWIAKKKLHSNLVLGSQDPHTVMSRCVTQESYFGRTIPLELVRESVDRVGQEQLSETVTRYLRAHLPEVGVVCVGPGGVEDVAPQLDQFRKRFGRASVN